MIGRLGCSGIFAIIVLGLMVKSQLGEWDALSWVLVVTGVAWIGSTLGAPRWQFRARALFCATLVTILLTHGIDFGSIFWSFVFGWWGIDSWRQGVAPNWAFDEISRENIAPYDGETPDPTPISPAPLVPAPISEPVAEFASDSLVARADSCEDARAMLAAKMDATQRRSLRGP